MPPVDTPAVEMARVVEIRVAGTVGRLVRDRLPGFEAVTGSPVTVVTGRLGPGEDLATVLGVLNRHGVRALGSRVYPGPAPAASGEPVRRERSEQSVVPGAVDGVLPAGHTELPVDRLQVGLDRVDRQEQVVGEVDGLHVRR